LFARVPYVIEPLRTAFLFLICIVIVVNITAEAVDIHLHLLLHDYFELLRRLLRIGWGWWWPG
jgi:hypothetical protein